MAGFDLFIGIDWSGAAAEHQKGIQVAEAELGTSAPTIIPPPSPKGWSRHAIITYLKEKKAQGRRVLAGVDFAFAHPWGKDGYYPDMPQAIAPQDALGLWRLVDEANKDYPHLYGGGIWGHETLRAYYNAPECRDGRGGRGGLYASRRRKTELVAACVNNRTPSPTFNCVGAAGVGTGSLAGMRMLNLLVDDAWIWPFSGDKGRSSSISKISAKNGVLVMAEIYPALYFAMAGVKDAEKKAQPLDALNRGLAYFNASMMDSIANHVPDHDDIDAAISSAALRALHDPTEIFPIDPADYPAASREGWIFGAGSSKKASC